MECSWFAKCPTLHPSPPTGDYITVSAHSLTDVQRDRQRAAHRAEVARARECRRARTELHRAHNVSLATSCAGVDDACAVGERIVLVGGARRNEVRALNLRLEKQVRDYVWGAAYAHITARGTISAADEPPSRICALNSTLVGSGAGASCTGDAE
mmetsp:Transcript_81178/g.243301  ORF Transcript_81178/g.243301 Transcript_81178/m.243301 type:complete len:155 (-) Transcript_81178:1454-1918(-)